MLRSIKSLSGFVISAQDGEIGRAYDFYFDDESWTIRYLVVETGGWLSGRRVLISPVSLGQPLWLGRSVPVSLTMQQVRNSPDINTDMPVSRQQIRAMNAYYGWPHYWVGELILAPIPPGGELTLHQNESAGNPHLRSANEVIGYGIGATDGEIGHVEDFIADDATWAIRYMVIDTRNWLPGRKVLVAPQWVESVSWASKQVSVQLTCDQIRGSPDYDPAAPVNREYEGSLYDYYGRLRYWD